MAGMPQSKPGDRRKKDVGRPAQKSGWKGKGKQRAGQDDNANDKASLAGKLVCSNFDILSDVHGYGSRLIGFFLAL